MFGWGKKSNTTATPAKDGADNDADKNAANSAAGSGASATGSVSSAGEGKKDEGTAAAGSSSAKPSTGVAKSKDEGKKKQQPDSNAAAAKPATPKGPPPPNTYTIKNATSEGACFICLKATSLVLKNELPGSDGDWFWCCPTHTKDVSFGKLYDEKRITIHSSIVYLREQNRRSKSSSKKAQQSLDLIREAAPRAPSRIME